MHIEEPHATALLLLTCGLLLAISVLFSRASQRFGVPIAMLFLAVGMLAGSEGLGGIDFNDYHFAFRLGYLALAIILFDGGLNTPLGAVRRAAGPAGVLATLGVALTAALVAVPATRRIGGWAAAALFVGLLPAHAQTLRVFRHEPGKLAVAAARIPFQVPMIQAALRVARPR
jgi:cell volume regulation protein A